MEGKLADQTNKPARAAPGPGRNHALVGVDGTSPPLLQNFVKLSALRPMHLIKSLNSTAPEDDDLDVGKPLVIRQFEFQPLKESQRIIKVTLARS